MVDRKITIFEQKVYEACSRVPKGRVSTYGDLAKIIGNPLSSRAVGNALHKNPFAPVVPCHRIVRADGSLGGFAKPRLKERLLSREGIELRAGKVVDFKDIRFDFNAKKPPKT